MRPLPDLTDLLEQPAVFDPSTDDFNQTFAEEFAGTDSQQAVLDQGTSDTYAAMDPIGTAIDALSSAIDAAGSVLDLLSGDLDLVNLDPEILNFQGYDAALDSNLSQPVDLGGIIIGFLTDVWNFLVPVLNFLYNLIAAVFNYLLQYIVIIADSLGSLLGYQPPASSAPVFTPIGD